VSGTSDQTAAWVGSMPRVGGTDTPLAGSTIGGRVPGVTRRSPCHRTDKPLEGPTFYKRPSPVLRHVSTASRVTNCAGTRAKTTPDVPCPWATWSATAVEPHVDTPRRTRKVSIHGREVAHWFPPEREHGLRADRSDGSARLRNGTLSSVYVKATCGSLATDAGGVTANKGPDAVGGISYT